MQKLRGSSSGSRIDWIDYGKGFCIILVVMMHGTLGVEGALQARGWFGELVEFARPFRIPAFFLLSGLLLSRTIDKPWPAYLDRKVAHFAYFYLLWLAISVAVKSGEVGIACAPARFLTGLVEPIGTLWFIYILPLFFIVTKLARTQPALIMAGALVLALAAPQTGWTVPDEFAARYVFFLAGYLGVRHATALADWAAQNAGKALATLFAWGVVMAAVTFTGLGGYLAQSRVDALALGLAGAAALIVASSLLAERGLLRVIRVFGENSLPVYLAFFLPMAATRTLIVKYAPQMDPTIAAALVTMAALIVPLLIERMTRGTPLGFLFLRPGAFHLSRQPKRAPA